LKPRSSLFRHPYMQVIFRYLSIWLPIFIIGIFMVKICFARIIVSDNPQKSLGYYPGYSRALLAQNEVDIRADIKPAQAEIIQDRAKKALPKAPLSDTVFLQVALAASLTNQGRIRRALFSVAKSRNIHNRRALLNLLAVDVAQNDIAAVVLNLDILIRLGGKDTRPYHESLALLAKSPVGRDTVNTYLENRPIWGYGLLIQWVYDMRINDIPFIMNSITRFSNSAKEREQDRDLHELFIERLTRLGAYEQALQHWQKQSPNNSTASEFLIHDGSFKGSKAFAPYNWQFFRSAQYYAEIDLGGGLYASYADKRSRALVRQVLDLQPGQSYTMDVDGRWVYKQRQGLFLWRLQCLPSGKTVAEIEMNDVSRVGAADSHPMSLDFKLPETDCAAQQIQLIAKPGQYSERIWARINSVKIASASATKPEP